MNIQETDNRPFMVSIHCLTYNHEPYIRQCLEGFIMQRTNFRFEAIVHDDASTDGTANIIREYAEKYPNIIKPIYETENQYSKHDGSLRRIMDEACTGKYIAICEGDDYWIDPMKLQIQVDFMESHPDYSMCWHDATIVSALDGLEKGNHRRYKKDTTCKVEEMIENGGEFCPTASLLFRKKLKEEAPQELFKQYVGDYPLQLYMTIMGKVYYFDHKMSAYRTDIPGSWTETIKDLKSKRNKLWFYEKKILDDFNRFSFYKYARSFRFRENYYLFNIFWGTKEYSIARKYWYKMDFLKRPWDRRVLYLHGYGHIKNRFDLIGLIRNLISKCIFGTSRKYRNEQAF